MTAPPARIPVRWGTPPARRVLLTCVLGSSMAFLDATVVNVALPHISTDLHTGIVGLQWVVDAYLVALTALVLAGGALGDRYGRRRVFLTGVYGFTLASLIAGLAPNVGALLAARALQGAAALLVPTSLSLLTASMRTDDRARAVGAWSGLTGVAGSVGPLLGGYLVDALSWRWVFLVNLPVAAAVVVAASGVRELTVAEDVGPVDVPGGLLAAAGLGVATAGIIGHGSGWAPLALTVGVGLLAAFLLAERRSRTPMLPLSLFSSTQFSGANVVTLAVYAGLGVASFLVVLDLQHGLGYSALEAGAALSPVTLVLLVLSARVGAATRRIGPTLSMVVRPIVAGAGLLLLSTLEPGDRYVSAVLPGVCVLGIGLAITVAPLNAVVMASVDDRRLGVASGVNNAVARLAGLVGVAAVLAVAGVDLAAGGGRGLPGYRSALIVAAVLCAVGGLVAALTIRRAGRCDRRSSPRCSNRAATRAFSATKPPREPGGTALHTAASLGHRPSQSVSSTGSVRRRLARRLRRQVGRTTTSGAATRFGHRDLDLDRERRAFRAQDEHARLALSQDDHRVGMNVTDQEDRSPGMGVREHAVLGVGADTIRVVRVEGLIVDRHAGTARKGCDHDAGCGRFVGVEVTVDAHVDTRLCQQILDDPHDGTISLDSATVARRPPRDWDRLAGRSVQPADWLWRMSPLEGRAGRFLPLHHGSRPLVRPNAWDVGSAKLLVSLGFQAIATTSSGFAATLGRLDGGVTRDEALGHAAQLAAAVDVPVAADTENGFADDPSGVAETVTRACSAGLAGCSIEDFTRRPDDPVYELGQAAERIVAAAEAAHRGPTQVVLTARAENHIHGRDDLADTTARLQAYQEAGADVLFAPGLRRLDDIRAVVTSVDRPVNVLAVPGCPPVEELASVGVARISVGGAFAVAALAALLDAANELVERGTSGYLERVAGVRERIRDAFRP